MADYAEEKFRSLERLRLSTSSQNLRSGSLAPSDSLLSSRSLRIPDNSELHLLKQRCAEYEVEIDRQREDIVSLRQQIDSANQTHLRELLEQRQSYETTVDGLKQEQERATSALQFKVTDLMSALSAESERCTRYRQELLTLKAKYNEELSALHRNIEAVVEESEHLKRSTIAQMQHDVTRYQSEADTIRTTKEREVGLAKHEFQNILNDLNARIDAKDSRIQTVEFELSEARRQLKTAAENYEKDVQGLQESLASTRHVMETQEQDLKRLKIAREDARMDARELAKEIAVLELEMKQMRKEKAALHSGNQKLERLLYGKSTRKASSPRPKHQP